MSEKEKCKVEGCKKVYRSKGYCDIHFRKWRRGEMPAKTRYKICSEETCSKPLFKFGMCAEHHGSWIASKKGTPAVAETAPVAAPAPQAVETPPAETPQS